MADYRQQEECEERRWTLERGLTRMEEDVKRGSALMQILEAERLAAIRGKSEQERSDVVNSEG